MIEGTAMSSPTITRPEERHHAAHQGFHAQPADAADHVEHGAYRRGDQPDGTDQHEHHAEIHRIDAGLDRDRRQHRTEDQNGRGQVQHHADAIISSMMATISSLGSCASGPSIAAISSGSWAR